MFISQTSTLFEHELQVTRMRFVADSSQAHGIRQSISSIVGDHNLGTENTIIAT